MKFQSTLPIQGETSDCNFSMTIYGNFNPLSLYRERQCFYIRRNTFTPFQSTLPIQGETRYCYSGGRNISISIHSPYTGRDQSSDDWCARLQISIHSPYTGRDRSSLISRTVILSFQSTLPIQGETHKGERVLTSEEFQSTLPIQGETAFFSLPCFILLISIHSPYTGRDTEAKRPCKRHTKFQSTLPIQGETMFQENAEAIRNFNPLSLYRERQQFCT